MAPSNSIGLSREAERIGGPSASASGVIIAAAHVALQNFVPMSTGITNVENFSSCGDSGQASATSDSSSSCSGGTGGGKTCATDSVVYHRQRSGRKGSAVAMQMRRYSHPRPSTFGQPALNEHEAVTNSTVDTSVADTIGGIAKTNTAKSTGVDSVDSADSGLTADHSSPEHRTSTPTTTHCDGAPRIVQAYPYQSPANVHHARPQTLPFHSEVSPVMLVGSRFEATMENEQSTSAGNASSTSALNPSGSSALVYDRSELFGTKRPKMGLSMQSRLPRNVGMENGTDGRWNHQIIFQQKSQRVRNKCNVRHSSGEDDSDHWPQSQHGSAAGLMDAMPQLGRPTDAYGRQMDAHNICNISRFFRFNWGALAKFLVGWMVTNLVECSNAFPTTTSATEIVPTVLPKGDAVQEKTIMSGMSAGTIVRIVIGSIVGVVAVVGLIIAAWCIFGECAGGKRDEVPPAQHEVAPIAPQEPPQEPDEDPLDNRVFVNPPPLEPIIHLDFIHSRPAVHHADRYRFDELPQTAAMERLLRIRRDVLNRVTPLDTHNAVLALKVELPYRQPRGRDYVRILVNGNVVFRNDNGNVPEGMVHLIVANVLDAIRAIQ